MKLELDGGSTMNGKYKTCVHVLSVGQYAVYVAPGCPRASMIKGQLVSSKRRCNDCKCWRKKDE